MVAWQGIETTSSFLSKRAELQCGKIKKWLHIHVMWSRPPSTGPCPSPLAHLPLLPTPIWTWAAHLLGSWAQNFPGLLSVPGLLHPSFWPAELSSRTQFRCNLLLKDPPLPDPGFYSLPPDIMSFHLSSHQAVSKLPIRPTHLSLSVDPQAQMWHSESCFAWLPPFGPALH